MIVPLPDLRNAGVEAPHVGVHHVVKVCASKLFQCFGNLAFRFGYDVTPDPAIRQLDFTGNRAVSVDRIAGVNKEVRVEFAHRFIDAHASQVGVDSVPLADGVARPQESHAPGDAGRRGAEVTGGWLAVSAAIAVFEADS